MTDIATAPVRPTPWIGPALVLAGGICIGFAPIGLRLSDMGPQSTAFWRYLMALPVLFLLVRAVEGRPPVRPNRFALMAGAFFALDIGLWHWALTLTSVANATFLVNLGNIGVGLAAWLFLRERLTSTWLLAVVVALGGASLLSLGGGAGGITDPRGDALAAGAAMLVAGYMLCAAIARRSMGAFDVIFWATAVEVVVAGGLVAVSGERLLPQQLSDLAMPLYLALAVQALGQGLIIAGLGRTSAAVAGLVVLVQPVAAAAVSWRLFGEALTGPQIVGAGLVLAGVAISQRRPAGAAVKVS